MRIILVSMMIAALIPCLVAEEAPLLETAMEVVARATSSSSVISLNLTGVIILVVLKIALIAFSFLNFGGAGQQLFGARSLYTPPGYSASDLTGAMCFLLYTNGDDNKMECIKRYLLSDILVTDCDFVLQCSIFNVNLGNDQSYDNCIMEH